MLRCLMVNSDV